MQVTLGTLVSDCSVRSKVTQYRVGKCFPTVDGKILRPATLEIGLASVAYSFALWL